MPRPSLTVTTQGRTAAYGALTTLRADLPPASVAVLVDAAAHLVDAERGLDDATMLLALHVGYPNARQVAYVLTDLMQTSDATWTEVTLPVDPFPLASEVSHPAALPTVAEWLNAGAPMREMLS